MKKVRFAVVFLLVFALLLSYAGVFASAQEIEDETTSVQQSMKAGSVAEEPSYEEPVDLKKQIVPEAEVPDLIDYSVAVAEKYVCRAYWEETDLNEVVFLKSDGTLARYYFAIPVKYEENGEVFDKKPALVERETLLADTYRYELAAQNDTAFYCPDNLTHGFLYQGGGMEVALRPITQSEYDFLRGHMDAGSLAVPGNSLLLPEGFDSQAVTGTAKSALSVTDEETTSAQYVLSTEGESVNSAAAGQDILSAVPSYNGFQLQLDLAEGALTQTVYFELVSELLPVPTEGGLLLCDQKGNPVGILGDLLSESGVQNDIPWTVTQSLNGTTLLSATLPRNGQTYTLSTSQCFDFLQDASIYSNDQNIYGQSANLWIGYHSSVGKERVLIRPNAWTLTSSQYPGQEVQSATMVIRDITATAPEVNIEVRSFTGSGWDEDSVVWNFAYADSYGPVLDTKTVSSSIGWNNGYYYSFNITSLAQAWYSGEAHLLKGMIFRWDSDHLATSTMEKCFASTQYSTERYRPRLEVTTAYTSPVADGVYAINNGGHFLSNETPGYYTQTIGVLVFPDEEARFGHLWRVKSIGGGFYTIRPLDCTLQGLGYDEELFVDDIGVNDNLSVPSNSLWRIIEVNGQYMLSPLSDLTRALSNPETTGSVLLSTVNTTDTSQLWTFTKHERVSYDEETSTYNEAIYVYDKHTGQKITGSNATVSLFAGEKVYLSDLDYVFAVATEESLTGIYPQWSSSQSSVTFGFDEDGGYYIEALNPLESEATDRVQINLEYSSYYGYLDCSLYVKVFLCDQVQYLKNLGLSDHFLNVENPELQTDSDVMVDGSFGDSPALWDFQFVGDGYYTIRAVGVPQNAFLCADEVSDDVELVYGSQSTAAIYDGTLWKVAPTSSGKMRLCSKALEAQSQALSFVVHDRLYPEDPILYNAVMTTYTKDSVFTDEWGIRCNTRRIEQEENMWCWAACIQMIELKYQENTKTQEELAMMLVEYKQIDTSAPNFDLGDQDALINEMVFIAETVIQRDLTSQFGSISTEDQLCRALDIGNLIVCCVIEEPIEHARVIYDYVGMDDGERVFHIFDPAIGRENVMNAYTFDELVDLLGGWRETIYYEFGNTRYY